MSGSKDAAYEHSTQDDDVSSHPQPTHARKKAFRFRPAHDIVLLKDVLSHSPWAAGHGKVTAAWAGVARTTSATIKVSGTDLVHDLDRGACKRRFENIMDAFRRGELFSLRSSGSEEDYEERARLLTDVNALLDDVLDEKANRCERERKYVEDREAASADIMASAMQTIRDTSAESLMDTSTEFRSPSRARQTPTNQILGYLTDKARDAAADREFQQKKLRKKTKAGSRRTQAGDGAS
ncbi:TPA: hypothetical protein N0F65_006318 [Lagenidium giganteum]|uniref:Uncharacterized protein n=1 Tax=Lagenidium giganteum TaxID=4803 RepID=A0AAV2YQ27_9STRA|nr:TPA: hypothetical protein N0F65_006318 [Lagenidium giganteum]